MASEGCGKVRRGLTSLNDGVTELEVSACDVERRTGAQRRRHTPCLFGNLDRLYLSNADASMQLQVAHLNTPAAGRRGDQQIALGAVDLQPHAGAERRRALQPYTRDHPTLQHSSNHYLIRRGLARRCRIIEPKVDFRNNCAQRTELAEQMT